MMRSNMATDIKIEMEGNPFEGQVEEATEADAMLYTEMAPKGRFTSKSMNALVQATNKLLPLFDQEPNYPTFDPGTYEAWPEDLTRIFAMFAAASRDAATEDVISPELAISLEGIVNDNDVQMLAGRVSELAKAREFKRWLNTDMEEEEIEPVREEEAQEGMSDEDIEALFVQRV